MKNLGNILIVGGAGLLGTTLTQKLLRSKTWANTKREYDLDFNVKVDYGYKVHNIDFNKLTVYDNLMYKQVVLCDHLYRDDFSMVCQDATNYEALLPYIRQADVVVALQALVGEKACDKSPKLAQAVNCDSVKFIVDNIRPDQKLILPTTNSFYGTTPEGQITTEESPVNPLTLYARTKYEAEQYMISKGNGISLRFATLAGVGGGRFRKDLIVQDWVQRAVRDKFILVAHKNVRRNFLHVMDAAHAIMFMLWEYEQCNNNIFNVGLSSANMTKEELANKIRKHVPDFIVNYDNYFTDTDKRDYEISNEKIEKLGFHAYYDMDFAIKELIKCYGVLNSIDTMFTNI